MQKDRNAGEAVSYLMTWINRRLRHCHSLHIGFPSATHPQQELRIFVATPPLAAFNTYKEREKEGRRAHGDTVLLEDKQTLIRFHRNSQLQAPQTSGQRHKHHAHKDKILKLKNKRKVTRDWNDNGNEIGDKLEGMSLGRVAEAVDGTNIYSALHS